MTTPFQASGLTKLVAATSSTSVAATQVCTGGEQGVFLTNASTVSIYVSIGTSTVSAAQPTTAIPATGLCLPGGGTRALRVPGVPPQTGWLSAVTSGGTAAPGLFATPGFGL